MADKIISDNQKKDEKYVPRKYRETKKHIYQKVENKKVVAKMQKGIIEITIPSNQKDFPEEIKSYIKRLCKAKGVRVEFQGELAENKEEASSWSYKLMMNETRVRSDKGKKGVVVWIHDKDGNHQDIAVVNPDKRLDSVIGIKPVKGDIFEVNMSKLKIVKS